MGGFGIVFIGYFICINLIAFLAMGLDKYKAKAGKWRIPEKSLFLLALIGGALGGIAGMQVFRHKTQHWYFKYGFPLLFIVNLAFYYFVFIR